MYSPQIFHLPLAIPFWIVFFLTFVHCYLYGRRVAAEERALIDVLGNSYTYYMNRTKRFIPSVV